MSLSFAEYEDSFGVLQPVTGFGGYVDLFNNTQYIIYADSELGGQYYDGAMDYIVNTVDLESGIIIKEINNVTSTDASIDFKPPSPTTTITPLPNQSILEVVFAIESDPAKIKTVSINTVGLIEVSN